MSQTSDPVQLALQLAITTRKNAHTPYSKFKVGAALKIAEQLEPIGGCNIENASFGATICAERTAILKAVSAYGTIRPEYILVVTDQDQPAVPCALCLQVMAEFAGDNLTVYLANLSGVKIKYNFAELLPHAFRRFEAGK